MDRNVRIGFVILTWNSQKVIGPCLESVFGMRRIEAHVVVVDNGSTDDTLTRVEAARTHIGHDASLTVLTYPRNMGMTVARNCGHRALDGKALDYYCNLDSDTVVNEEAFLELVEIMESYLGYGIVGPKMMSSAGVTQHSARRFPTLPEKLCKGVPIPALNRLGARLEEPVEADIGARCYPVDYLMGACLLIRPEALRAAGPMDERIFYGPDDADFCLCVWKAGYQVAYCPRASIIHEWQRLSKRKLFSRINWMHVKGLAHMFLKHRYLFGTKRLKKRFPVS